MIVNLWMSLVMSGSATFPYAFRSRNCSVINIESARLNHSKSLDVSRDVWIRYFPLRVSISVTALWSLWSHFVEMDTKWFPRTEVHDDYRSSCVETSRKIKIFDQTLVEQSCCHWILTRRDERWIWFFDSMKCQNVVQNVRRTDHVWMIPMH